MKAVTATEFKRRCLNIIGRMVKDQEPVTVTKHGIPVAVLSPVKQSDAFDSAFGAMEGTVLEYEDPFLPATDSSSWKSLQ